MKCVGAGYATAIDGSLVGTQRSRHHILHEADLWRSTVYAQSQHHSSWSQSKQTPETGSQINLSSGKNMI